jgi:hypothetical protein
MGMDREQDSDALHSSNQRTMKYQLVLQWISGSFANDYDSLIATEALLIEKMADRSTMDSHDLGSGEINIFILTDDPHASFAYVRSILESSSRWTALRAPFREADGSEYTILWPKYLTRFGVA